MGYYTRFELNMTPHNPEVDEVIENDEDSLSYALSGEECKWYDHDKDMMRLSEKFPETLFELKGEGEEAGDIWLSYYKNGKMQHCPAIITYEEFDESKLK